MPQSLHLKLYSAFVLGSLAARNGTSACPYTDPLLRRAWERRYHAKAV